MCITEVSMNGKKVQAGKFRDRNQLWIDGNSFGCDDHGWSSSPEIKIKNGVITKDACGKSLIEGTLKIVGGRELRKDLKNILKTCILVVLVVMVEDAIIESKKKF